MNRRTRLLIAATSLCWATGCLKPTGGGSDSGPIRGDRSIAAASIRDTATAMSDTASQVADEIDSGTITSHRQAKERVTELQRDKVSTAMSPVYDRMADTEFNDLSALFREFSKGWKP